MIPAGAVQRKTVPPQMHKTKHWRRNKMNRPSVGARQLLSSPEGLALLPKASVEIRTQCRLNYYFMGEHHGRKKRLL